MCGRTGQAMAPAVIEERWDVRVPADYEPRYNVAPGEDLVTVPSDEPDVLGRQEWGLLPEWVDDAEDWHYPINARAETVAETATFREAVARRPCLVPSSGYYEWSGDRGGQPYRICREDREPFALAGIWERWSGAGGQRETVAILTCEANAVVEPIHDRMPVVLAERAERRWLRGDLEDRLALLEPPEGAHFEAYPISTAINDPTAEGPDLIEPLGHDQGELGSFGA